MHAGIRMVLPAFNFILLSFISDSINPSPSISIKISKVLEFVCDENLFLIKYSSAVKYLFENISLISKSLFLNLFLFSDFN